VNEPDEQDAAASTQSELAVPGGRRARAEEWALVLASQGIASRIRPGAGGFVLDIEPGERASAEAAIRAFVAENPPPPETEQESTPEAFGEPGVSGLVFGLLLIGLHLSFGQPSDHNPFFASGSADADQIVAGQWWRCVTALCLHADLAHVVGNAFFGLYFVTALARLLGPGLAIALVVAAGGLGNALNAISHERLHDSVGASTAVFGAIGLLTGLALARRSRAGVRGGRLLVPLGAGLGLLAMLGTSGARVDLWAHLYGLVAGVVLGVVTAFTIRARPAPAWQVVLTAASALFVLGCWQLALGA
jgi:membrane associated rhomboid family serine protease